MPVGQVNVNALLPVTGGGAQKTIVVSADKPTDEIVLEIPFDAAVYKKARNASEPAPSASGAATRAPAASVKAKPTPAPARSASP